jgi:tellurite methyltransferase
MEQDRIKWDARYAERDYLFSFAPSRFLADSLDLVLRLAPGSRALDLACGEGRNALYLAQHGFQVTAIDISQCGLDKGIGRAAELGVSVEFLRADLDEYRIDATYDLIIDFNFLLRPLIPGMVAALAPGGVIVMETILDTPGLEAGHTKHFLLHQGELERIFSGFAGSIEFLEEESQGPTPVARVVFRKTV